MTDKPSHMASVELAWSVTDRLATLPQIVAIVLGGSRATGADGPASDIDLYVYTPIEPAPATRAALLGVNARAAEFGVRFFEAGDCWIDPASGLAIDVIYRTPDWIEDQLRRVLERHQVVVGYSTCLWSNVLTATPLHDPTGWYAALQQRADVPFPAELRRSVIALNHPLLRDSLFSFRYQIVLAVSRNDAVSVQHRTTALIASWFDVLFALNRRPHPGEKRLVPFARERCPLVPADLDNLVETLLVAAAPPWQLGVLIAAVDALIDPLDALLLADGLI